MSDECIHEYNCQRKEGEDGFNCSKHEPHPNKYTLAALEQARRRGAEDERGRCKEAVHKIDTDPEFILNYRSGFYEGRRCAEVAIEDLGPIGETREETERRVRRETVEAVGRMILGLQSPFTAAEVALKLNAIVEGK